MNKERMAQNESRINDLKITRQNQEIKPDKSIYGCFVVRK